MEQSLNPAQAMLEEQYSRVTEMIHCYAESVGLNRQQVYNSELKNWRWKTGTASIEILIAVLNFPNGGRRDYLRIFAPLMDVPSNNLLAFYRHLLELNDTKLCVKLSIMPNSQRVYATYERDIKGMDFYELKTCIIDLEYWAVQFKADLNAQFPDLLN